MNENQSRAPKDYCPAAETEWWETRLFGIYYREDSSKPDTHDLIVNLDGTPRDLTDSNEAWNE